MPFFFTVHLSLSSVSIEYSSVLEHYVFLFPLILLCVLFLFFLSFILYLPLLLYAFRTTHYSSLYVSHSSVTTTTTRQSWSTNFFPPTPRNLLHTRARILNVFFYVSTVAFALQTSFLSPGFQPQLFVSSLAFRSPFVLRFFPTTRRRSPTVYLKNLRLRTLLSSSNSRVSIPILLDVVASFIFLPERVSTRTCAHLSLRFFLLLLFVFYRTIEFRKKRLVERRTNSCLQRDSPIVRVS